MINEIPVKLPSQLLISKTTTSFDNNFDPLNMNNRVEEAKFEHGPTFENTINDIKDNNLKIIASATMNLSPINLFDENFKQLCMNTSIEGAKFEPEPTFENTNNEIKDNYMKSISSAAVNLSAINLFDYNHEQLSINIIIEVEKSNLNQHLKILIMRSKLII